MKTYIIKNRKDLEKYKDDSGYHIKGNAEFKYSAGIAGRLLVDGHLSIEAGGSSGIVAGLHITCETTLSFGLRLFAGTCNWKEITDEDKTVTCGKLLNGTIEYGILKETGLETEVTQEAALEEITLNGVRYRKVDE